MVRIASLLLASLVASCGAPVEPPPNPLETPLGLARVPLAGGVELPTLEQVELGKQLFFDPRLSVTGEMSCNTCHHADKAWTDGRDFSPKHNGKLNTRNTPTVYNVGYLDKLYWDGRTAPLETNIKAAWTGQMGGKPDDMAETLAGIEGYKTQFESAFGGPPTGDRIIAGLAAFLRTLRTGNSPYDRYKGDPANGIQGDQNAISTAAKKGESLFNSTAGCHVCHQPPLFTDRTFHNTGVGLQKENPDLGRGKIVDDPKMDGAFKTPTLRGVAKSAPYFHDASKKTLEEAVRWMVGGGYDNPNRDIALKDTKLSDEQIKQLVAFLETLTSDETFVPPTLPK